ncbi:MAG: glycosyltransferase, partial [Acidobacteriota bacterium]
MTPTASISITTYQHAHFIRQCLASVLMQETTFPFEILLGEDDSTDGTREICQEYADKHPDRIRLFLHKREDNLEIHGRATGRRNLVNNLQQAKGKYIALLDGDDYWTDPTKLQRQFDVLENDSEATGCFHDCEILNEETGTSRRRVGEREIDTRVDTQSLIRQNNIPTASMFFRNVIDWHNPPDLFSDTIKADYLVALMVSQHGPWTYLDRLMSVYRVHPGGLWSGVESPHDNHQENVEFFAELAQWPEFQSLR